MPIRRTEITAGQIIPASERQVRLFRIVDVKCTGVRDTRGNCVAWEYGVSEIEKAGRGYGTWRPIVAEVARARAYNCLEDGNTGIGRQANGVDHDGRDYPDGFAMQPCPVGAIVQGVRVDAPTGSADATRQTLPEVWFMYPNAEDGVCRA